LHLALACRPGPRGGRCRRCPPKPDAAPSLALRRCANSGVAAAIATHRMKDGLTDRKFLPQDRPDRGAGLIAILLLSVCLAPVGLGIGLGYTPISLSYSL
jgi:hypothetical protein